MAEQRQENPTAPQASVQEALIDLVTGKTLGDLTALREQTIGRLDNAHSLTNQLLNGSTDEVVKALQVILSAGATAVEYPALPMFEARATPQHRHASLVRLAMQADVPVWLHGEAGSGKSTTAHLTAQGLGLPFRSISLGPTTSKSDLLGYRDAGGTYHDTGFRRTYEDGGLFLFDEIDNAHPSSITILNSALANGFGEFPDGKVPRADTTRFIASANTIGKGANAHYVGRAPIDAATLDRFAFVPMDIDEQLEQSLILGAFPKPDEINISEGGVPSAREWLAIVRANREAANELGIRTIISPRAAIYGKRMAELGMGNDWLLQLLIYKGMNDVDREKMQGKARTYMPRVLQTLPLDHDVETDAEEVIFVAPRADMVIERDALPYGKRDIEESIEAQLTQIKERGIEREMIMSYMPFVTALAWNLEKEAGVTLVKGNLRALYNAWNNDEGSQPIAIDRFIARNSTAIKRGLVETGGLPATVSKEYLVRTLYLYAEGNPDYVRVVDNINSNYSGVEPILAQSFYDEQKFQPGPLSLAYWIDRKGITTVSSLNAVINGDVPAF